MSEENTTSRYCVAKDGQKWRVFDDSAKRFAEPFTAASDKAAARQRAAALNAGVAS